MVPSSHFCLQKWEQIRKLFPRGCCRAAQVLKDSLRNRTAGHTRSVITNGTLFHNEENKSLASNVATHPPPVLWAIV